MSVSRETPPASAVDVFGDRLDAVDRFAQMLATDGVERGLIGPREVPRLWDRHLTNCGVVLPRVPVGSTVADVGSGAGLPGMVWAIARPDLQVTLIEPLLRRTSFLEEACQILDLQNVSVVRARAEDVETTFEVVTARAVAPMEKLARWCLPLVAPGGVLLALKGRSARDEVSAASRRMGRLGVTDVAIRTYGQLEVPTTVVEVTK